MVRISADTLPLAGEGAFGGDGDALAGDSLAGDSLAGGFLAGEGAFGSGGGAFGGGGGAFGGGALVDPQRKRMSGYITDAAASALFISSFSQSRYRESHAGVRFTSGFQGSTL